MNQLQIPRLQRNDNLTVDEIKRIISILGEDEVLVYNHDEPEDKDDYLGNYFICQLDERAAEDQFYDFSVPFSKIFKELNCICTGFQPNHDYKNKSNDSWNPHYGIWFTRLELDITFQNTSEAEGK